MEEKGGGSWEQHVRKKGDSEVAAPLQKIRLKRNAAEIRREKEAIRSKRLAGGENVGSRKNEIGALETD